MKSLLLLGFILVLTAKTFGAELQFIEDSPKIPEVFQREYIETNIDEHRFVQTYGLATCVAIVIYEEESTRTILSHIDARVDLNDSLPKLLRGFKKPRIILAGGEYARDFNLMDKMIQVLEELGHDIYSEYRPKSKQGMSVIFDIKEARLYGYYEKYRKTQAIVDHAKNKRMHFGGREVYRHEESIGGGDYLEIEDQYKNEFDIFFNL